MFSVYCFLRQKISKFHNKAVTFFSTIINKYLAQLAKSFLFSRQENIIYLWIIFFPRNISGYKGYNLQSIIAQCHWKKQTKVSFWLLIDTQWKIYRILRITVRDTIWFFSFLGGIVFKIGLDYSLTNFGLGINLLLHTGLKWLRNKLVLQQILLVLWGI